MGTFDIDPVTSQFQTSLRSAYASSLKTIWQNASCSGTNVGFNLSAYSRHGRRAGRALCHHGPSSAVITTSLPHELRIASRRRSATFAEDIAT